MGLRNLRSRIRDTRSGDTTDPLGQTTDPWLDAITPDVGEDTDPGGADLADPAALPAGGHPTAQTLYGDGVSRCLVAGCGTPTTGLVCVDCTKAGRLPPDVDVYVAPFMERILPDPPLHTKPYGFLAAIQEGPRRHPYGLPWLDGAGYVLEPLPDVADFDEARARLRTEVIGRIDAGGAA